MLGSMDDLELLRHEFSAGDGLFLLQLRVDLHWDWRTFSRLEQAMRRVCTQQEPHEQLVLRRSVPEGTLRDGSWVWVESRATAFVPITACYYQKAMAAAMSFTTW
jgi:hypothetical protein